MTRPLAHFCRTGLLRDVAGMLWGLVSIGALDECCGTRDRDKSRVTRVTATETPFLTQLTSPEDLRVRVDCKQGSA